MVTVKKVEKVPFLIHCDCIEIVAFMHSSLELYMCCLHVMLKCFQSRLRMPDDSLYGVFLKWRMNKHKLPLQIHYSSPINACIIVY